MPHDMERERARKLVNEWLAQGEEVETAEPKRFDVLSDDVQKEVAQIAIDLSETSERFIDLLSMLDDNMEDELTKTRLNQSLNELIKAIKDANASVEQLV